jgi:hypothetical protein
MAVFTIYCHGTGGHRDKPDKEIVAAMGRRAVGQEYVNYLILDGVGGTPKNKEGKNPMAGTFNWADKNKGAKGGTPAELGGGERVRGLFKSMRASASGFGLDDNVRHAIVAVANLIDGPGLPDTINMIGWSRGAITAISIANALFDPSTTEGLFRSIRCNIYAIDPVAGAEAGHGPDAESKRLVPPTVKNLMVLLATGENRTTFSPQDLSRLQVVDKAATNAVFLPFPGKHSTVAQQDDPKAFEVANVCWTLAYRFFRQFGTDPGNPARVLRSDEQMLDDYSGIVLKKPQYAKIRQKGFKQWVIGKGFGQRDFAKNLDKYVLSPDYFINEHHRALFMKHFPQTYDWLFTLRNFSPGLTSRKVPTTSPIGRELSYAVSSLPQFFETLYGLGVNVEGTIFTLPAPGSGIDTKSVVNLSVHGDLRAMGAVT